LLLSQHYKEKDEEYEKDSKVVYKVWTAAGFRGQHDALTDRQQLVEPW
jgi:hypothetical protein